MNLDELANERIDLGGFLVTRAEAFRALVERGADMRAANYAMHAPAVSDDEAMGWPEALTGFENLTSTARAAI